MARRLDNWLHGFLRWTLDRSESPEMYLLWSGLFAIASATKRNISIPDSLLGAWTCYPSIYVLFVARPGIAKKSSTMGFAEKLLQQVSGIHFASDRASDSGLLKTMQMSDDGSVVVMSSEFGNFVRLTPESMYDMLVDLFDGRKKLDQNTRQFEYEIVENPCVNLIACTTPDWIAGSAGSYITGGGFSSRILFVFADEPRQREIFYDSIDKQEMAALEKDLVADLQHMATLKGEFTVDEQAKPAIREWYRKTADSPTEDVRVENFHARKHTHLLKLCMLLSLAEGDSLIITTRHFEQARQVLDEIERTAPRALVSAGKNQYLAETEAVEAYIRKQPAPVRTGKILARFMRDLNKNALLEVLHALQIMGKVKTQKINDELHWYAPPPS